MHQTLTTEDRDGVLVVRLSRPDRLNAFTVEMADDLEQLFRSVNDDDAVRAVVVTGEGRAFCAGMELASDGNVFGLDESLSPSMSDLADLSDPALSRVRDTGGRVALAIHDCHKPVLAAINGAAVGIGATMTLAMDRRLMADSARIGLVFGRLGIVPEATSTWYLSRIVGPSAALDLVLRADILPAADALAIGLVDEVLPAEDLVDRAIEVADAWTRDRSPAAVAIARHLVRRGAALDDPREVHRLDSLGMFWTSVGDGKEGVAAFLAKRPPQFTSRASDLPDFVAEWLSED